MNKNIVKIRRVYTLLSFILIAVIFGCTPSNKEELYGVYYAEYRVATEKLILNADGEYVQEVKIKGNPKIIKNKGRWHYDPADKYLTLKNALVVINGFGELNKDYDIPWSGIVVLPVMRFFPWSSIRIGSEEGVLYIKSGSVWGQT